MDFLRQIHTVHLNTPFGIFLSTPFVAAALVLFLWSWGPAINQVVRSGFLIWLRLTWALLLLPAATGIIFAVGGEKVPSATNIGGGLTKYHFSVDPKRDSEHWMYTAFCLLSLYIVEVLIKGRLVQHGVGLKFLPIVTLFLYGCAFMISRVAVFPGHS